MKKELRITKLKVIIIFFTLILIIYFLSISKNKQKNDNLNNINETNKVVYREEGLPSATVNIPNYNEINEYLKEHPEAINNIVNRTQRKPQSISDYMNHVN